MDYETFVKQKRRIEVATGHNPSDLNEHLFDWKLACQNIEDACSEQKGLFA